MQDLLTYLRNNDLRIKEIEKDEKISLSNVTGSLLESLKSKEDELNHATDERKKVINVQMQSIKNYIEIAKDENKSLFSQKKVEIQKDSLDKILNYAQGIKANLTDTISTKEGELKIIKNNIVNDNNSNDFESVEKLSKKAQGVKSNIINYKNLLDDVNNLTSDIENTINRVDNLTFEGIDAILNGYKNNIMEIEILSGFDNENVTTKTTGGDKPEEKPADKPEEKPADKPEEKPADKPEDKPEEDENLSDDEKALIKAARQAVEKARKTGLKRDIKSAYQAIDRINNASEKEKLTKELEEIIKDVTSKFMTDLNVLTKIYETNKYADVKREEIAKLIRDFDNLYKDEIPEINFSKSEAGSKVQNVILSYNATKQKEYQLKQEVKKDKNGKVKKVFNAFKRFLEIRPILSGTKLVANFFKKMLAKNVKKGNEEKVKKYEKRIREMDIINNVTMFRKKNEIAKMSAKLYENGVAGLDSKEKEKYEISQNVICGILLKQLLKKTDDEVYNDKLRVKTVISQWLDLYSRVGKEDVLVSDTLRRENVSYSKEDIRDLMLEFIQEAYKAGTITISQFEAYEDEMVNIDAYKRKYDSFYEIPSVKYEDGSSYYEELNDKAAYYENNPVTYTYVDKDNEKQEKAIFYLK